MGRGNEKTVTCVKPGCGYTYTHKRMDSKGFRRERMLHVVTGECAKRVQVFNDREVASRLAGGGVTMTDVTEAVAKALVPVYELLRKQGEGLGELKERVERRIESRKKKRVYIERDSKPPPWTINKAVLQLKEQGGVIDKFKEIMTKEYDHGWSWERAVSCWLHWMLDQCSADPILLMAHDEVRYHESNGPRKVTKLQFFRCFAKVCKDYNTLDEGGDAFFVGFWYPMVKACRGMLHWENRILFALPTTERAKREFDEKIFPRRS